MTMSFTGARPVRFERGLGWIECEPHRAQRWQSVLADRVLTKAPYHSNKHAALDHLAANVARHAPLPRNYKFGKRMPKQSAR